MKKDAGNLEFVGEADKEDQKYIFENFPSINFVEKQDADEDIGKNYLMPSVAPKDVKTTEYSDEANKTIAYRNYMFTAYKKKGENNKYILCFKRVITGKTSKNSAYLRLPAELCGGNKVTTNDQKIVGSSPARSVLPASYGEILKLQAFKMSIRIMPLLLLHRQTFITRFRV